MAPKSKTSAVEKLIAQRESAQNNMSRICDLINSRGDSLSEPELQCRLAILDSYFQNICDTQLEIEACEFEPENQRSEEVRGTFEDIYCEVKTKILTLINKFSCKTDVKSEEKESKKLPENLPKLKLPSFSGKYSDYPNFKRLFYTLVHNENRLSTIEKYNHLISCLSGPALRTVKALDISEDNYDVALKLLNARFDNKFLICQDHIKDLCCLQKVQPNSSENLRVLVDTVSARFNSLSSLLSHEEMVNAFIVHQVLSALDTESQSKVEESIDYTKAVSWEQCMTVLTKRCQMLETHDDRIVSNKNSRFSHNKPTGKKSHNVALAASVVECSHCKMQDHSIWKCKKFLELAPLQRFSVAKASGLCINCLGVNHTVSKCRASKCTICNSSHHTLLHRNKDNSSANNNNYNNNNNNNNSNNNTSSSFSSGNQQQISFSPGPSGFGSAMVTQQNNSPILSNKVIDRTILATVVVKITDKYGKPHFARALLDSASQLNFITKNLAQRLQLPQCKVTTTIGGIGEAHINSHATAIATIGSCTNNFATSLSFVILPTITGLQPESNINIESWNIPENIRLADPKFNISNKIDLLIGADMFFEVLHGNQIKLNPECPILFETKFGWVVSGKCQTQLRVHNSFVAAIENISSDEYLGNLIQKFWELESIPEAKRKLSQEQAECETHFQQHVKRLSCGRFMVKLPFKKMPSELGNSKEMALRRFISQEKRLLTNPLLKSAYVDFLNQYESDGHMEKRDWPAPMSTCYFLPHHCVLRPDKSTTKCRVVFDASAKTSNHLSLNDILMVGPVVQNDLFAILLRFRFHKFALMADITAMYRQIQVYPEDHLMQNIIWRSNIKDELNVYKLKTVTYGTASAPYLATRCLKQLADDNMSTNSMAANIIKNDFYVDDLITGGETLEELNSIKQQVSSILMQGKFQLRKWYSNHQEFLKAIPEDEREKTIMINNTDIVKALGILWDASTDTFKFYYSPNHSVTTEITKRKVLSELSKLFDPLGLIKPVVVKAKIFLQELWLKKLDWDEVIPQELTELWIKFVGQLISLNNIKVERHVLLPNSNVQLHGFADASTRAYGCCFYIRCVDANGNVKTSLYTAKSKVAPISTVRSIPCLELCAAQLLVQLLKKVENLFKFNEVFLWSDSIIVLGWLAEHASNYNTFVANRVAYIQEHTAGIKWRYVPSKSNPADMVSRGATMEEIKSSIWFSGPNFLQQSVDFWPEHPKLHNSEKLPERKVHKTVLTNFQDTFFDIIYSSNNFIKICTRFSYIRRFINHCRFNSIRVNSTSNQITAKEIDQSFMHIISLIQQKYFATEIQQLQQGKHVQANSVLKSLNPFLEKFDGFQLLKVGGRLKNSNLPYQAKCPIILPKQNQFIESYVKHLHVTNLHAGAQALVCEIQKQFWIIGAREYARKIIKQCVLCFKYRPKLMTQIMGDLPRDRVMPVKPFTHCGVDFCGPILTTARIRGQAKYKSYIAVFICFATRAVHLEVVSALTAEAFIAALKRFIGHRGLCHTLYCDNATNFVGAKNVLKELKTAFISQQYQRQLTAWCSANEITFQHIPPRSPHFGGLWEAAVKSAKTLLYKTMQSAVLTFEELSTVVAQIEGILNSRPLTAMSNDPSDERALTPAHFLNQARVDCIIEPSYSFEKISCLKHWQQISSIQQHFWNRWSKEFLTSLQHRRKWSKDVPNIEIGTLVMVHDDNLPPQKWIIGRVINVIPGHDKKIRVADIKTPNGTIRRSITKLAALPVESA